MYDLLFRIVFLSNVCLICVAYFDETPTFSWIFGLKVLSKTSNEHGHSIDSIAADIEINNLNNYYQWYPIHKQT